MRLFSLLFITLIMLSCNSHKTAIQKNPPFQVAEAGFQQWFDDAHKAGKRTHFHLVFTEISGKVHIDSIYFRGKTEALKQNAQNPKVFLATLVDKPKPDIVLDSNPLKEINNPRPSLTSKIPFELKPDEAIIRYRKNNKVFYFKIESVKEKEAVHKTDDNN